MQRELEMLKDLANICISSQSDVNISTTVNSRGRTVFYCSIHLHLLCMLIYCFTTLKHLVLFASQVLD